MASRDGIYHTRKKKDPGSQYFVREARYHPNGFTVYKVIRRVPDPHSLDCFKESSVWKRYSDFRDLYKCLATLHRKLYLKGQVPEFAKPKLFGRFDEGVVEDRRKSAEQVLHFATEHPPLLNSAVFKEFFQGLQPVDSSSEIKYLKQAPLKPNVREERKSLESEPETVEGPQSGISEEELLLFDPFYSTKDFINSTSRNQDETWINQIKQSISQSDVELGKSPDSGEAYHPRELDSDDEAELLKTLEVSIGQVDLQNYHKRLQNTESELSDFSPENALAGVERKPLKRMDLDKLYRDEHARSKHRKSSKASAYLEAVIKQTEVSSNRDVTATNGADISAHQSTQNESRTVEKSFAADLPTRSSLLDLPRMYGEESTDDETRGEYVVQAAQQISFAKAAELRLNYEEAFGHYKTAINTLLHGVQDDTNEGRVQAVRRKTENYLKRAEDIHSYYLKSTTGQDLWKVNPESSSPLTKTSYMSDVEKSRQDASSPSPNAANSPRHSPKELSYYKVLGTIGKVLLVLDTRSGETYAMKILIKSSLYRIRRGVIPTNVPYMVRLHRYYSTDEAICLVMEHASGGKLWDQLQPYFEMCRPHHSNRIKPRNLPSNDSIGASGFCSTPRKDIAAAKVDPGNVSEQATSFLDVCLEYRTVDHVSDKQKQLLDDKDDETAESRIESNNTNETASIKPSKPSALQRTWSYLSWDDPIPSTDDIKQSSEPQNNPANDVFSAAAQTLSDFKRISSQGDMKLFTIDPDEDAVNDLSIEASFNTRSIHDITEEQEKANCDNIYSHELLSEQDMSAVSLISDEGTLIDREPEIRSNSLSLSRIINESKSSPCLSMNSSFEDEQRKIGAETENLPRIVDENGVSSVDAKTVFRTHSRTKSTASVTENNKVSQQPDIVRDIAEENTADEPDKGNKIHSVFMEMDAAKKSLMTYRIPEYTVQRWAAEMIVAVGTLHSVAILCRDLNPDNILISDDGHIRLSYFGKWRQIERKSCDKLAVGRLYVAPEMSHVHEKKTEACDWWSVGALLYELLTGTPLSDAHPAGISSHTVLSLPDHLSPEAKSLLTGLLQYYPTQRLGYGVKGLDDLMEHPFFNETEWDILIEECNSS